MLQHYAPPGVELIRRWSRSNNGAPTWRSRRANAWRSAVGPHVEFGCGIGHVTGFGQHHEPAHLVHEHLSMQDADEPNFEKIVSHASNCVWLCRR